MEQSPKREDIGCHSAVLVFGNRICELLLLSIIVGILLSRSLGIWKYKQSQQNLPRVGVTWNEKIPLRVDMCKLNYAINPTERREIWKYHKEHVRQESQSCWEKMDAGTWRCPSNSLLWGISLGCPDGNGRTHMPSGQVGANLICSARGHHHKQPGGSFTVP